MTLGRTIRERRLAMRATLEEIAHRAQLDASNLSRIERDIQTPSAVALQRIAEALGVPIASLLENAAETEVERSPRPAPHPINRDADLLLKLFFRLAEDDRVLAVELLRTLEKTRRA